MYHLKRHNKKIKKFGSANPVMRESENNRVNRLLHASDMYMYVKIREFL